MRPSSHGVIIEVLIVKNCYPKTILLYSQFPAQFGQKSKMLRFGFSYALPTVIFMLTNSVPVNKVQFPFNRSISPKEISINLINTITHTTREGHGLHRITRHGGRGRLDKGDSPSHG